MSGRVPEYYRDGIAYDKDGAIPDGDGVPNANHIIEIEKAKNAAYMEAATICLQNPTMDHTDLYEAIGALCNPHV